MDLSYDTILRMILKYSKTNESDKIGSSNGSNFNLVPTSNETNNSPTDPYEVIKLDNYDYSLLYNEEDDLIGFTSNKGTWKWTFGYDSYDELIYILCENPYANFKIVLVYTDYDPRKNKLDVDDKGNLTDVVLVNGPKRMSYTRTQDVTWYAGVGNDVQDLAYGSSITSAGWSNNDTYNYDDGQYAGTLTVESLSESIIVMLDDTEYQISKYGDFHGLVKVVEVFSGIVDLK